MGKPPYFSYFLDKISSFRLLILLSNRSIDFAKDRDIL